MTLGESAGKNRTSSSLLTLSQAGAKAQNAAPSASHPTRIAQGRRVTSVESIANISGGTSRDSGPIAIRTRRRGNPHAVATHLVTT